MKSAWQLPLITQITTPGAMPDAGVPVEAQGCVHRPPVPAVGAAHSLLVQSARPVHCPAGAQPGHTVPLLAAPPLHSSPPLPAVWPL